MKGDWCGFFFFSLFSRGLINHVAPVSRSASSYLFPSATWCCLPIFQLSCHLNRLQYRCILCMCTNMQTHTHGLLFCSVGCILWWIVQRHPLRRGRDVYLPTWQLCRCTHLYSPCPLSLTLHFSHFHTVLILYVFNQILFPSEVEPCVASPVCLSSYFHFPHLPWQRSSFFTSHVPHFAPIAQKHIYEWNWKYLNWTQVWSFNGCLPSCVASQWTGSSSMVSSCLCTDPWNPRISRKRGIEKALMDGCSSSNSFNCFRQQRALLLCKWRAHLQRAWWFSKCSAGYEGIFRSCVTNGNNI